MGAWDLELGPRGAAFCLVHLAACVLLMLEATPDREALHSWAWRIRRHSSQLRDAWQGDRSPSGLMLATFGLIGVGNLFLLILLPAVWQTGLAAIPDAWPLVVPAALVTVLLILTIGIVLQWLLLGAGHDGAVVLWILLPTAIGIPHLVGQYFHLPWLLACTPSAWFVKWLSAEPFHEIGWFAVGWSSDWWGIIGQLLLLACLYGVVLVQTWLAVRRRLKTWESEVAVKLGQMGVAKEGLTEKSEQRAAGFMPAVPPG
jgi:hypothetical protein